MEGSSVNRPAPYAWPPYSHDPTPCDFFLWKWIKDQVYRTQPAGLEELKRRIVRAFREIPPDM
uniref:Uncharacterized protein n=1 Tax=Ditylenchus dipsaci TaxID=166011 RepID=A0A915E3U8_9BILA